jgi:hypothetical protein
LTTVILKTEVGSPLLLRAHTQAPASAAPQSSPADLSSCVRSTAGMVGHGHGAEAIFIGCLCIAVLLFFLGVGIWQQKVWLPRRAKELVGEMQKDRMEKRI